MQQDDIQDVEHAANRAGQDDINVELLYDAQQGRSIHTLSRAELSFYLTSKYYFEKSGNPILYVFEQYPLDMDDVNRIRRELGFPNTPPSVVYSTDFVFELSDGQKRAYSIKASSEGLKRDRKQGSVKEDAADKLEIRQEVERRYWVEKGVPFAIVIGNDLNPVLASNLRTLHFHADERFVVSTEQKALWLAAHGFIEIKDIEINRINGAKLVKSLNIDVDDYYRQVLKSKKIFVSEWTDRGG